MLVMLLSAVKHCKFDHKILDSKICFYFVTIHDTCVPCRTYTPSLDDVGSYLALKWIPIRADGKCGKPLVAISTSPVNPGIAFVNLLLGFLFTFNEMKIVSL